MHLRKVLTIGAAVLAAGLLSLSSAGTAATPTGVTPTTIVVNGVNTAAAVPIDGTFKSGTASYGANTYGCTGGTVAGNVQRGARAGLPEDMRFSTLSIACFHPAFGLNATISLPASCVVTFEADRETNAHAGLVSGTNVIDTGTTAKINAIDGTVRISGTTCPNGARITIPGGCAANVSGNVNATFDEAQKNGTFQVLGLNGAGLTLSGQTALCFGLMTGGVTLNNIQFNLQVTGGNALGIDFQ